MTSRVTTSFQMDYRMLLALQKRGRELGFRSWGAYVRHMVEFHAVTFEPDAVFPVICVHSQKKVDSK